MEQAHVKTTPKDVFLHLFNIVTFYLSIIGFITLFVNYINALFPDPLNYYFSGISAGVRWASSVLFIATPAYLISSWMLSKDIKAEPEKRELKLRKWLIYFTLFISAITVIIDLMVFVYFFLDGEITTRFFLKILVVLLVAAAVFGYYFWELKRKGEKTIVPKILTLIVSVVVLGSIVAGFFIIGTPSDQRNRRFDDQRVMDLQNIQSQVINYWTLKEKLPENIAMMQDNISWFAIPQDPKTKESYEYRILEPLKFEICANFAKPSQFKGVLTSGERYNEPKAVYQENWEHESGRTCFVRTIDPELYKNKDKVNAEPVIVK